MPINTAVMGRDFVGTPMPFLAAPEYINQITVTAGGTPEDMPVPAGADVVVIERDTGNILVGVNKTSGTAPTGDLTDGTAWEPNPDGYLLRPFTNGAAITNLRVQGDTTGAVVTFKFYKLSR